MTTTSAAEKALVRAVLGERVARPPFWLMRQAGRYLPEYRETRSRADGFLDLCYTPALAVEVTLQPIRRYAPDAAIIFSDILVIPDALGQPVRFEEGRGPLLDPVTDAAGVTALGGPDRVVEHLAPVYEAVSGVAAALPDETALIGFAGAPWTVATYMVEGGSSRDFATVKGWAFGEPDSFGRLIDLLVAATIEHLDAQIEAGAEVIQLFESWAGILPEPAFRRWCLEPVAAIVSGLRARRGAIPIIAFPRGCGVLYDGYAEATGVDAVSLDATVPIDWAATTLQRQSAVQGNLDPIALVVGGPSMTASIDRIVAGLGGGPFVFNLGHGVLPQTPPEHVAALAAHLRGDG